MRLQSANWGRPALVVLFLAMVATLALGQQGSPIPWKAGPLTAPLGSAAQIRVPKGFLFTGRAGTRTLLDLTKNPPNGTELGAVIPNAQDASVVPQRKWLVSVQADCDFSWGKVAYVTSVNASLFLGHYTSRFYFVLFDFKPIGYVSDRDQDQLDASALLKRITDSTEAQNQIRQKRGWPEFHVVGWQLRPFYLPATHNLTWALLGRGDGDKGDTVNYSTRILGRRGTMNVDLVMDPSLYGEAVPQLNQLLSGYAFTPGNRYAEFVKGDKLAGYGLAALVAGGAAATALKLGLFGKLWNFLVLLSVGAWKLVLVGFAAVAAFFKRVYRAMFGKKEPEPEASSSGAPPE